MGKFGLRQASPLDPGLRRPASWRRLRMPSPRPCSITCSGTTRSSPGRPVRAIRRAGLHRQAADRQARPARPDPPRRPDVLAGLHQAQHATRDPLTITAAQVARLAEPSPPTTGHGHNRRILAMARSGQLPMPSGQLKDSVTRRRSAAVVRVTLAGVLAAVDACRECAGVLVQYAYEAEGAGTASPR